MRTRTAVPIDDTPITSPTPPRRGVYWYYSNENQSPLVREDFLARERRLLLSGQYAREHQNLWVDAADSFTSALDLDAAMGHGWTEQLDGDPSVAYVITVDLGLVHDPTVIALGHTDDSGRVIIDRLVTYQGSHESPVQLASVEASIRDLAVRFPCWRIRIESWQGISAAQSLTALGLPVELVTPTAKNNSEEWPILAQRLSGRTIVLPPHARLREELLNLTYEVGATGIRVIDKGSVHQDHAVAVRMLVAAFAGQPTIDTTPSPEELSQLRSFAGFLGGSVIDDGLGLDDESRPSPLRFFRP
jgi:hypothetical protein